MVREADLALMLEAGTEVGVASTKAFTAMLIDLLLLALCLGRRKGLPAEEERDIVEALHGLPAQIKHTLEVLEQPVRALAQAFVPHSNALFLGRGEMYPIALEGALKLKEISYIHAEGYPAGELKHGPLALVDEHMPVVAVAPNDELLEKLESNLQEVRARGGRLYVFADEDTPFEPEPGVEVSPCRLRGHPRAYHSYASAAASRLLCSRASGHGCGSAPKSCQVRDCGVEHNSQLNFREKHE